MRTKSCRSAFSPWSATSSVTARRSRCSYAVTSPGLRAGTSVPCVRRASTVMMDCTGTAFEAAGDLSETNKNAPLAARPAVRMNARTMKAPLCFKAVQLETQFSPWEIYRLPHTPTRLALFNPRLVLKKRQLELDQARSNRPIYSATPRRCRWSARSSSFRCAPSGTAKLGVSSAQSRKKYRWAPWPLGGHGPP